MKRRIAIFAVILVILTLVGTEVIGAASANPINLGEVPPDSNTHPPRVSIISPENISYNNSSICLNVTVNSGNTFTIINKVYCKADWLTDSVGIFSYDERTMFPNIHTYSSALNLTDIPAGTHSITVYAVEVGTYDGKGILQYYTFKIQGNATVTFTINAIVNPTPTASQSIPTINTGPKLPLEFNFSTSYIILVIEIITVVGLSVLLIYFKRRKQLAGKSFL
jgi:hypothetical protein